jgi:hypothetical protein
VSSEELREGLVADWARAYLETVTPGSVVMLGLTNHDVEDLNLRAREHLVRAGRLGDEKVIVGGRGYRAGDQVVTRQNDYRLGVLNGQRWMVREIDHAAQELVLEQDVAGHVQRLPFAYAETSRLQHGYALTTALAQGSTVERAFVLGSDATYREAGYTAASRARGRTQFYVVSRDAEEGCEERHGRLHVDEAGQDPLDEMTKALSRSAAQHLVTDTPSLAEPVYIGAESCAGGLSTPSAARGGAPRRHRERLERQVERARAELERATQDRLSLVSQPTGGLRRRWGAASTGR